MTLFDTALKLEWIVMAAGVGYMLWQHSRVYSETATPSEIDDGITKFDNGVSCVKLSGATMLLTLCTEMIADL